MQYISHYASPIGPMTMGSDGENLTGLWFDGQRYDRSGLKDPELVEASLPVFDQTVSWLELYFTGKDPGFLPPLRVTGSEFKKTVAEIMLTIPFGQLMTYGQIAVEAAKRLGKDRMSAQAVGGAVGHNHISLLIPCHRVVGTGGSLTGYGGGIERKVFLLKNEGIDFEARHLYVPTKGTAL